ncbi:branched-chain amino acid ABC transporter permease [Chloroflexi bacterium TSY]|nr:branched-chain amino acid ABC transporter permease [Chloroflexi bacterium TSY]
MSISSDLFLQFLIAGLVIGVLYALMAIGITFIYSVMKLINWSMGEFYMIGSYLQYLFIVQIGPLIGLPQIPWYLALPLAMIIVFLIGVVMQRLLIKPMFVGGIERRNEYATIITLTMVLMLRSLASALGGPYQRSPGSYIKETFYLGPLPVSGDRLAALIGAIVIMVLFYIFFKRSWFGVALRAASQSRVGVQTAGVNLSRLDQIAFGVGVALAAGAGALLAPVFLVYPTNGEITTMKGFEIIIIGGLGSIPGALIVGIALGVVESLGAVFIDPNLQHVYGFVLLLIILIVKPTGLFGEQEREV